MLMIQASALRFWLLVFAAVIAFFWVFNPVLFPFLAGIIIAYFLEPAVSALEKRGVRRWLAFWSFCRYFLLSLCLYFHCYGRCSIVR